MSTIASSRIAFPSWKPSPLLHAPWTSPSPGNLSSFYCFHIFAISRILCSYSHPACNPFRAAPSLGQKRWPNNFKVRVILFQHSKEGMVTMAPWKWEFTYTHILTRTHTHTQTQAKVVHASCLLCVNNEETGSSDGAHSGYNCAGYNLRLWRRPGTKCSSLWIYGNISPANQNTPSIRNIHLGFLRGLSWLDGSYLVSRYCLDGSFYLFTHHLLKAILVTSKFGH